MKKMPGALVFGVVVADFNVDGKLDFAVSSDGMFVFPGNGDGIFGSYIETPNVDSYSPRVGDFNRDGKPDIIGPDYFLTGKGDGTFNVEVNLPVEGLDAEAVGDFNHDGAPDVINGGGDFVTVLLNTGAK